MGAIIYDSKEREGFGADAMAVGCGFVCVPEHGADMGRRLEYLIDEGHDGRKVVHFLRGQARISARLLARLKVMPDGILRNGEHVRTIDRLRAGDVLWVNLPEEDVLIEPMDYELDVVFEDADLLVINKPAGLAMHPTHNHQGDTLANAVSAYLAKQGKACAFRAVGRLDKGTSGLVLCALNKYAASRLSGEKGLAVEKTYFAIADGLYEGEGTIDRPIVRPDPMKTLRAVGEGGDRAVTHWRSLSHSAEASLLEIWLETGRTHQIRVHFASLGTPLLGDDMYGGETALMKRPALHCASLAFAHPVTGERLRFCAEMPEDMRSCLAGMES